MKQCLVAGLVVGGLFAASWTPLTAQVPIGGTEWGVANLRPSGQPVIPIFEGWYQNADRTYDLCFGYFNLNTEEEVHLPLGPDNFIEPSRFDGSQPTHFEPVPGENYPEYQLRRPHCVFTVTVPEEFGSERVVWTLRVRGRTYSVPGHLTAAPYVLEEPDVATTRRTAPVLRFEPDGPEGRGRNGPGPWGGITAGPRTVAAGDSLTLTLSVGPPPHGDRDTWWLGWSKYQGPPDGDVTFGPKHIEVYPPEDTGTTTVTFSKPGRYVLLVQAIDWPTGGSTGFWYHCCWTNGFVEVDVTASDSPASRSLGAAEAPQTPTPATPEAPQTPPPGTPIFELDPSWPTVPDQWVLGEVSSIGVAAPNRLLVLHRPRSAPADERHMAAPPVLEFDIAGNFLRAWGGAGNGYEWPEREHGIDVDYRGNVWIGGNNCPERNLPGLKPVSDDQLLKFSGDGRFLMQIGRSNQSSGSSDSRNVRQAGDQAVYPRTNEVFVADGYGNRRVIVFDADTGEFKRMWGAFGNEPIDYYGCPPPSPGARSEGDDPPQFLIVHAIAISNDGFVYVADREYGRIQIFTIAGEFVDQTFMPRNASGNARAGDMAFSADPQQEFMYVAAGAQIVVIRRLSLEILYSFSGSGHHIATDSEGNLYTAQTRQRQAQKYVFQGLSTGDGR